MTAYNKYDTIETRLHFLAGTGIDEAMRKLYDTNMENLLLAYVVKTTGNFNGTEITFEFKRKINV